MAQLVYETTDPDFASRALEAMREAGIACYRTGRGWAGDATYLGRGFTENRLCIYIESDTDYVQANQILISLGAVVETPPRPPSKRVLFVIALVLTVLACCVALHS